MEPHSRIARMIPRLVEAELQERLHQAPAVVLLGPRQVGKTTLALRVGTARDAIYLDLESAADRARLAEPELYLARHLDRLIILDEVHRTPNLFPVLRGLIDRARREGRREGLYLLLGSTSFDLLRQSGESLAGRASFLELTPINILEGEGIDLDRRWLRGGFPESLLAADDRRSNRWREDFIRTYLERDIPQLGPRIAAETLRRFWTMLAHHQGGLLNVAQLARNIGVDSKTAGRYLELLVDLFLVRRLPAWHANVGKRLVKSPKIYLRDSGLLHALLGIESLDALLSHPIVGASWEGFVLENLLASAGTRVEASFYRTSAGAEIDLLLTWPGGRSWAIEIKRSLSPKPERGFHEACADLRPQRRFIVYPGEEEFPVGKEIEVVSLRHLASLLRNAP